MPYYHTLTHANVWESIRKPSSCMHFMKSCIFKCKSRENSYQVLQVTRAAYECAIKTKVCMISDSYTMASRAVQVFLPEPDGEGNKTCTARGSHGITVL